MRNKQTAGGAIMHPSATKEKENIVWIVLYEYSTCTYHTEVNRLNRLRHAVDN